MYVIYIKAVILYREKGQKYFCDRCHKVLKISKDLFEKDDLRSRAEF